MNEIAIKNYNDTFLYGKGDYHSKIYEYLMKATMIDKKNPSFEKDIKSEIKKRQTSNCIAKVLDSKNIILMIHTVQMPRAFKVFAAKNVRGGTHDIKVYIDVTGIIREKGGIYEIDNRDIDKLISYLLSAMNTLIYHADPSRLLNNNVIITTGTTCFSELFTYIIDYLRVGNVDRVREKCLYLSSLYYQINMLKKDDNAGVYTRALKNSSLTQKEADILKIRIEPDTFDNISTFIRTIAKILNTEELKIDNFIDKWIYLFGSGTQFGTELYSAFASMLTNAYVGSYLNNQKQIEKITGRDMVDFTTALLKVGSDLLK